MALFDRFIHKNERYVALLLLGTVLSTCFNGYDVSPRQGESHEESFTDNMSRQEL